MLKTKILRPIQTQILDNNKIIRVETAKSYSEFEPKRARDTIKSIRFKKSLNRDINFEKVLLENDSSIKKTIKRWAARKIKKMPRAKMLKRFYHDSPELGQKLVKINKKVKKYKKTIAGELHAVYIPFAGRKKYSIDTIAAVKKEIFTRKKENKNVSIDKELFRRKQHFSALHLELIRKRQDKTIALKKIRSEIHFPIRKRKKFRKNKYFRKIFYKAKPFINFNEREKNLFDKFISRRSRRKKVAKKKGLLKNFLWKVEKKKQNVREKLEMEQLEEKVKFIRGGFETKKKMEESK